VQDISKRISDREGSATASLNIGTVNYFQGRYPEAIDHYRAARQLFIDTGNKTEAARALFGLGLALQEKHDLDAALEAFEQAHREFVALNDRDEVLNSLSAIGSVQYARGDYVAASKAFLETASERDSPENLIHVADALYMQGEYAQAVTYYEKALDRPQLAPAMTLSALGSAANSYYYLANYDRALDAYQKALAINERMGDKTGAAIQLQGLGNTHRGRGDFGAALDCYFRSLTLSEGQPAARLSSAQTLGSIGLVRALQGQNTQALEYFQKSLTQFEAIGDNVGMARMLSLIGNVNFLQANYQQALDSYQKSLALREAMGDKTNSAHNLTGIATTYLALGREAEALETYERALTLFQAVGNQTAIAHVLTKIADAQLLSGDHQEALSTSQRAVDLAKRYESFNVQWYALTQVGKAQRLLAHPAEARAALLESIAVAESQRFQPATSETGAERSSIGPLLALLELDIDQNNAAEAFQLAERAKLVTLREILNRSHTRVTKGSTGDEQASETRLANKFVSASIQLERQEEQGRATEAALQRLRAERRATRIEYETFVTKMYAAHPDLKVNRGELTPVGFAEAGALMGDEKEALLEFAVTDSNTYLFVLTDQRTATETRRKRIDSPLILKAYPLNLSGKDLAERLERFRQLLLARDEGLRESGRELYDLLLKPAEDQLNGKTRLTVVPDGVLWGLPFEALQAPNDQYLIDSKTISYAPSFSALREMRKRADRRAAVRAGSSTLGNPVISKEVSALVQLTYSSPIQDFVSTNTASLEKIRSVYGGSAEVFSGPAANEDRLKSELSRSVVHVDAPLILDDASPMYSTFVLSAAKTNGLFQLGQLLQLNSTARTSIMSSAETIHGSTGHGNATLASSWAWFVAGTPTVVLGRWPTESGSREQVMVELHRKFKTKSQGPFSTAEAMRASALLLRRTAEYHHPYYWSGFAVLGDAR
jgi:tetratricopeptide (TPR) repeat protein